MLLPSFSYAVALAADTAHTSWVWRLVGIGRWSPPSLISLGLKTLISPLVGQRHRREDAHTLPHATAHTPIARKKPERPERLRRTEDGPREGGHLPRVGKAAFSMWTYEQPEFTEAWADGSLRSRQPLLVRSRRRRRADVSRRLAQAG